MAEWPTTGEALRYLGNARAILRRLPVERSLYRDRKPARDAMGTAYLAVLDAINEALNRRGAARKELPRSVEAYPAALQRHLANRNGKLMPEFESLSTSRAITAVFSVTARSSRARSTPPSASSRRSRSHGDVAGQPGPGRAGCRRGQDPAIAPGEQRVSSRGIRCHALQRPGF
jgi:hypothetical protein